MLPAGDAWQLVLQRHRSLTLYSDDGLHPTFAGTYLASLVIYQALYKRSPVGLPGLLGLKDAEVRQLQEAASDVRDRRARDRGSYNCAPASRFREVPMKISPVLALTLALVVFPVLAQTPDRYKGADGKLRVALAKQPLSPNGPSTGPTTMANGGIQKILADLGATVRVDEAALTADEDTEYGGWKRLGMALGHFADIVSKNERDGYFTVGLLATCPSMPGWSPACSIRDRRASRSGSACCGSTRIPTSTRRRRRAADRSAGCRWPSRPAARCR